MKVVALVSGGKDSCYAMMKCIQYGHQIVALANLMPADDSVDELDSYMYQTVGHQIIVSYAECMGLPLFRRRIQGSTRHHNLSYRTTPGDEVEDMFILLNEVKRQIPSVAAVSSGAIASDYQRLRVESVCSRLGLVSLAYLWKQDQSLLLQEMIENGILAITVKVAAMGLDPAKHLGKELASLHSYLHKLKELYGINVCGEGGEFETLTLDCPLFVNARIMLDKFQVVLHSSDSIAPAGVLHPLAFHVERKKAQGTDKTEEFCLENIGSVFEVQGDCSQTRDAVSQSAVEVADLIQIAENTLHISKTQKGDTFSVSCWLQDSHKRSPGRGLQEELTAVLRKIETRLGAYGFGWENVLYIHLYIVDMKEFAIANETYVRFVKQEKCPFGVPSRSTVELPLLQVGLGSVYVEVLVANDHTKSVLHVQSISCWAPSCIGPYSQATLHKNILHMAGQLGLDPPTMTLREGGVAAELEKALENSEAVAKCFKCSISTSTVIFVIYCSTCTSPSERNQIREKVDSFLKQIKVSHFNKEACLRPSLPFFFMSLSLACQKGIYPALVEIKPILFVQSDLDATNETIQDPSCIRIPRCWGFQQASWHDHCVKKCFVSGVLCAVILSITSELVVKICSDSLGAEQSKGHPNFITEAKMNEVSRFCVYLLDKVIMENDFSWDDTMYLRLYFPASLGMPMESLSLLFTNAFAELAAMGQTFKIGHEPIFNLVPVIGAGSSAAAVHDIMTCELLARKL